MGTLEVLPPLLLPSVMPHQHSAANPNLKFMQSTRKARQIGYEISLLLINAQIIRTIGIKQTFLFLLPTSAFSNIIHPASTPKDENTSVVFQVSQRGSSRISLCLRGASSIVNGQFAFLHL